MNTFEAALAPITVRKTATEPNALEIRPLRYVEIPRLLDTIDAAFARNPFPRFIFETPDLNKSPWFRFRWRAMNFVQACDAVRRDAAWTVNGGDASIQISVPASSLPPWKRILERAIAALTMRFMKLMVSFGTRMQKNRLRITDEAYARERAASMGDLADTAVYINLLGVSPALQGHGIGLRLVKHVTALADAQSQAMWLQTTLHNTPFYQRAGFKIVSQFTTGEDDDSTWKEPPVVHCLMTREPITAWSSDEVKQPE